MNGYPDALSGCAAIPQSHHLHICNLQTRCHPLHRVSLDAVERERLSDPRRPYIPRRGTLETPPALVLTKSILQPIYYLLSYAGHKWT
jgi:hypothetical protein